MSYTWYRSVDPTVCIFFAVYVNAYDWRWIDRSSYSKRRKIIPRLKSLLNNIYQLFFYGTHFLKGLKINPL